MIFDRLPDGPLALDIDGLELNVTDESGTRRTVETFTRTTGVDQRQIERANANGEFPQTSRRSGQSITIAGDIYGPVRAGVMSVVDEITNVLADGGFGTLTIMDDDATTKTALVQLLQPPGLDWVEYAECRYQVQLSSPYSYLFGATSTASTGFAAPVVGEGMVFPLFPDGVMDFGPLGVVGGCTVVNDGTADAPVMFTVTGPTPSGGFVILDDTTSKRITFLGSCPAGSSLVLNGADGSVVINGTADRLGDTIVEAWPMVPKASSRSFTFQPLGTATASVLTASCTSLYW